MKLLVVLGVAAVLCRAQGTLPSCAASCATSAIGATGCSLTDAHCVCTSKSFTSNFLGCVQGVCDAADQQATLKFAQSYCLAAGVTITVPASSASASGSTPASSAQSSVASSITATVSSNTVLTVAATKVTPAVATYTGVAARVTPILAAKALGLVGLLAAL